MEWGAARYKYRILRFQQRYRTSTGEKRCATFYEAIRVQSGSQTGIVDHDGLTWNSRYISKTVQDEMEH